ncbi:MAG: thioesterase family protein [Actinobacteria bacterium]|jgi:acyl-CoA thioester hydrolase|nr:thioesterase family protein [Actinomycetota bacterium]
MAHRLDIDVRFYELDPYNHVNHAVYIQYFETARIAVLADAGYTLQGMMEDGVLILVTQIDTKFIKPAAGGDHLVVETEVLGYTRVMTKWRQRLLRGDEVLVDQKLSAAVTNLEGRPLRFPRAMIEALRPYQVSS